METKSNESREMSQRCTEEELSEKLTKYLRATRAMDFTFAWMLLSQSLGNLL